MLGRTPARLGGVVDRSVLEIARDGVQAEPARRVRIGEPHAIAGAKRPPGRWLRDESLHAAGHYVRPYVTRRHERHATASLVP